MAISSDNRRGGQHLNGALNRRYKHCTHAQTRALREGTGLRHSASFQRRPEHNRATSAEAKSQPSRSVYRVAMVKLNRMKIIPASDRTIDQWWNVRRRRPQWAIIWSTDGASWNHNDVRFDRRLSTVIWFIYDEIHRKSRQICPSAMERKKEIY